MTAPTRTGPQVYQAINRISRAFACEGIAKRHMNIREQYAYRSLDDVVDRLGPLLARHNLCVLPRVLRRECEDRAGEGDTILVSVRLLVAFDLVSCKDGSRHVVKAWGEALDSGDKGTAKAMSSAYKGAMLQLFCVPVASEDTDASSLRLKTKRATEPVEGWGPWANGILDMIGVCESPEALDRVRTRQSSLLGALARERPDQYALIGERFSARREALAARSGVKASPGARPRFEAEKARHGGADSRNTPAEAEAVDG
jgi:hypothetical protein